MIYSEARYMRNQITKIMMLFHFPIDPMLNVVDKFNPKQIFPRKHVYFIIWA